MHLSLPFGYGVHKFRNPFSHLPKNTPGLAQAELDYWWNRSNETMHFITLIDELNKKIDEKDQLIAELTSESLNKQH